MRGTTENVILVIRNVSVLTFSLYAYNVSTIHSNEAKALPLRGEKEAVIMQKRSEEDYLPQVMSLNPTDLINWCRNRKQFLGLSNQKLADQSGIPVGTIDRIMAGKYTEFRYSSIQPIVSVLIGFLEDTPKPETADSQQVQNYYDTIEGYKLVVENKNHVIDELNATCERLKKEIDYLTTENERKHEAITSQQQHTRWLEAIIDDLRQRLPNEI